jgi:transposase
VAERVRVREITSQEGNRLLRIVRRSSGSVVTWRRAQMVLLSAQGMDVSQIAQVTFTSPDRVRDVLHNFNLDGFDALYPRYRGGRPPSFTLAQRRAIKQLALSRPVDHDLPAAWAMASCLRAILAQKTHRWVRILIVGIPCGHADHGRLRLCLHVRVVLHAPTSSAGHATRVVPTPWRQSAVVG